MHGVRKDISIPLKTIRRGEVLSPAGGSIRARPGVRLRAPEAGGHVRPEEVAILVDSLPLTQIVDGLEEFAGEKRMDAFGDPHLPPVLPEKCLTRVIVGVKYLLL